MAGLLRGTQSTVHEVGTVFAGEMGSGRWVSDGVHKAVLVAKPYGSAAWELFNIEDDPGETRDLSSEQPELLDKLTAGWQRYADEVGVVFPPKDADEGR